MDFNHLRLVVVEVLLQTVPSTCKFQPFRPISCESFVSKLDVFLDYLNIFSGLLLSTYPGYFLYPKKITRLSCKWNDIFYHFQNDDSFLPFFDPCTSLFLTKVLNYTILSVVLLFKNMHAHTLWRWNVIHV